MAKEKIDKYTWHDYNENNKYTWQKERGTFMDREEILAKSRRENRDEGRMQAEYRGNRIGTVVISVLLLFILVWNWFFEQNNAVPLVICGAYYACTEYSRYLFERKKKYLIYLGFWSLLSIFWLMVFVIETLR